MLLFLFSVTMIAVGSYIIGYDNGKQKERDNWQEVLVALKELEVSADSLMDVLAKLEKEKDGSLSKA